MNESFVKSLSVNLPPELEKLKGAGYFDEFEKKACYHLERNDLPEIVKNRIILEIHNARIIKKTYTLTEKKLFEGLAKYCPGFSQKDFDQLEGDVDYVFINGKKRYVRFSVSSLFITSKMLREWPNCTYPFHSDPEAPAARALMREKGKATVDCDIEFICTVSKKAAAGNDLTIHLPYPSPNGQGMSKIEFVSATGGEPVIAPEDAPQRTACFHAKGDDVRRFSVRVKARNTETYMSYEDLLQAKENATPAKERVLRRQIRPEDLAEKAPHYVFSPFIKALSEKIVGDETNKTVIAKKIYDYITHEYQYAYVRSYATIDNLPEYFALRGRGDCGLQASLLITLCRYNGIPARWDSGICTDGESGGDHDWTRVYFEGVGFRPVDPSVGGGCRRRAKTEEEGERECAFYFGNMDPYRMIFNTDIQEPFQPAKEQYRLDPYDNQEGEAETAFEMLGLKPGEVDFSRVIHSISMK